MRVIQQHCIHTKKAYLHCNFFCVCTNVFIPVSPLYSFPKIHTGSEVSGKSSNSPKRNVSYVKVAKKKTENEIHVKYPKKIIK